MHWCEGENITVIGIVVVSFTFLANHNQRVCFELHYFNALELDSPFSEYDCRVLNVHNVNVRTSGPGVMLHDVT